MHINFQIVLQNNHICLQSRPGSPNVVRQLVSQLVRSNVENSDQMTE